MTNIHSDPSNDGRPILYPPKTGLHHDWQPGEVAVRGCHGWPHSLVLEPVKPGDDCKYVLCLDSSGIINSHNTEYLLTIEDALKHCEYMRRDWTGRQYDEAVEAVRGGFPFKVPREWSPDMISRVVEPLALAHALAVQRALGYFCEF